MRVEYRDSVLTREQSASAVPTRFTTNRHSSLRSSQGRACASSGEDPDGVAHSAGGEERSTPRSYGEKTSSWTPSRVSIRRSARSGRLFVMTRSNLATFRPSWGRATVSSVRSKLPEKGGTGFLGSRHQFRRRPLFQFLWIVLDGSQSGGLWLPYWRSARSLPLRFSSAAFANSGWNR